MSLQCIWESSQILPMFSASSLLTSYQAVVSESVLYSRHIPAFAEASLQVVQQPCNKPQTRNIVTQFVRCRNSKGTVWIMLATAFFIPGNTGLLQYIPRITSRPNCSPPTAVWERAVFKYPEKLELHDVI